MVSFEVGQFDLFKTQLPKNRWQDSRCEWVYKSIGFCDYGRDEFEGISQRRISLALANGADLPQGWKVMNASNAILMDIDLTYPSELLLRIAANKNVQWNVSTRTGPFIYRIFDAINFTNWEVEIKITGIGDENDESVGMLFSTDSDTTQDWLYACHRFDSGNERIQFHSMDNNTYTPISDVIDNTNKFLKIKKTGSLFEFFKKASETAAYGAATASVTRADLTSITLRAGITAETYFTNRTTIFDARVDYWRLLSGGFTACDRTLANCTERTNIRRFGAAPGILHGSMIL